MICDICKKKDGQIDGKTIFGCWAFMCEECHKVYGCGLGLGKGQKLKGDKDEKVSRM